MTEDSSGGGGFGTGFVVGALLGTYGGIAAGGGGSGKMAARGYAQSQQVANLVAARVAAFRQLFDDAARRATLSAGFMPGERTFELFQPAVTPQSKRIAEAIFKQQGAHATAKESLAAAKAIASLQGKLAKEQLRAVDKASVRYVATSGPNTGPPLAYVIPPLSLSLIGGR